MRKILLAMTALLAAYMSDAQMPALINSGLLLQQGNQLHEEGKYKEAIALYKTVPRNDTNYLRVLYELAMSHERDSSFEQALLAIRSAEEMGTGAMRARFQLMKANVYDDMSQPARALAIYDSVLVEYPESDEAMLNRAITLMRLDRHAEAETQLKTLLVNNPYYASAHMKIAGCALKQGRIVPGMMALFTYLIVSPEGRHSRSAINLLNELSNYSPETQEIIQGRKQEDEVFAREERVVLSKMAFDRNYKLQTDIDDKIIRQLQALFDIVKYDESSSDFYMQYYVPFLRTMAEKKRFEPVVMHAFSGVKLEVIQKYHKKHSREVKAAIDDIVAYLDGIRGTRELIANKRSSAPALYAIANNRFVGKGLSNAKQDPVGDWEYYYEQGNLKAIAHYNSEGKREGTWKYFYANGRVSGIDHWSNGVQTGTDTVYFMDGVLSSTSFYKDGELDGNRTLYHGNGRIKSVTMFKNGKEEGPYKLYFSSGRTQVEGSMKDEKIHGAFTRYYRTGVKELECMYENGELNGGYKSYHDNGKLAFEGSYKNGVPDGVAKNYHANGKLKEERVYVNGLLEGPSKSWDDAGVVRSTSTFVKGNAQGTSEFFDYDGKRASISVFDKGVINEVRYFDKTGKEIAAFVRKGRKFPVTAYTPDGSKNCDQTYNDKGERDGLLTLYYPNGKIRQTIPYKNGLIEGTVASFYPDGTKEFEAVHKGGEKDGLNQSWHPNGKLQQVGYYSEGDQDGDWVSYNLRGGLSERYTYRNGDFVGYSESYLNNGSLDFETIYDNGWIRGLTQYDSTGKRIHHADLNRVSSRYWSTYPNGQKRYEVAYEKGDFHGKMQHFYFNGKIQTEKTFDRGLLEGAYVEYHYNGKTALSGQYLHGERTGVWKHYNEDGILLEEENFVSGSLEGKDTYFYLNGKPKIVFQFKAGDKHGLVERFDPSGTLIMTLKYFEGDLKAYSYLGKDGKLVPFIPLPDGTGRIEAFYPNGAKSAVIDYLENHTNGEFSLYYDNGQVLYKGQEIFGLSHGAAREYSRSGQLLSEFNHVYEQTEGPYKEYHENGKLKEEGVTVGGSPNGWVHHYDATGKRIASLFYYYGLLMDIK